MHFRSKCIGLLCVLASMFTACQHAPLSCRSEYLYPDYLASERISTPDPCRHCFYGQQIVVFWDLDRHLLPDELRLHVRYGTREQATMHWPLSVPQGYRVYRIVNDEYWCKEGIVSYKAELYHNGECVFEWKHHLWMDILTLDRPLD